MKNVLIDFSHLGDFCGFGEIARNYSLRLSKAETPDIHFIFIVPDNMIGKFGNHIDYIRKSHKKQDLKKLGLHIDLWHATDQQYRYRKMDKHTIQLLTIHDLNYLREKTGFHKWRHILQIQHRVNHSDYLTAISGYVKNDILNNINTKGLIPQVIYNGICDVEVSVKEKPAFVKEGQKFLFTIGQIREKKNFQKLIPMMKYLKDYHLYICGDDHFEYARELQSIINLNGEGRVKLCGKIKDSEKNWLYANCSAFVFPSRLEGFGIPVLEAMRFRKKIFSSNMSSLPEICSIYATYWDNFNPENMAETIKRELKKWDTHSSFADEMMAYSKNFNYDKYTEQYLSLYRNLLAKGK